MEKYDKMERISNMTTTGFGEICNLKLTPSLSKLSLADLVALLFYLDDEYDSLEEAGEIENLEEIREQIILTTEEIRKLRNKIFG